MAGSPVAAAGTPHAGGGYPSRRIDYIFVGEARAGFYPSQCSSTTLYQVSYRIFVWGKETPRLVEVARAQKNNDSTAAGVQLRPKAVFLHPRQRYSVASFPS